MKKFKNNENEIVEIEHYEENEKVLGNSEKEDIKEEYLEKIFEKFDSYLKKFENEIITEEKIKDILDKVKNESEIIDTKLIKERIWGEGKKVAISNYEDYEKKISKTFTPVLNLKFKSIDSNLIVLNKANIYDFLHSEKLSLNFWDKKEIEKKRELLKKNNAENDAKKKLYSFCEDLVEKNEIEEYNEYLEKIECLRIRKELEIIKESKQKFDEKITEQKIKNFTNEFKDIVDEKTSREIFCKYFENDFNNDEKIEKINIAEEKRPKSHKKILLSLVVIGVICSLMGVFFVNQFSKQKINKENPKKGDREKMKELVKKAADKGDPNAINNLGAFYLEEGNEKKARELIAKAAAKGSGLAMKNLGYFAEKDGDIEKAKEWYKKAAENGNADAMNTLGVIYGDEGNQKMKREWLEKAMHNGSNKAINNIAKIYEDEGNIKKAKELYEEAISKGNIVALHNLGHIYESEGDVKKAKEYYEKAVAKGFTNSMYRLGVLYEQKGNKKEAEGYYRSAAAAGDKRAKEKLEKMK